MSQRPQQETSTNPQPNEHWGALTKLAARFRRLLRSEDGPTAVEYAVMLALIVVVCLAAVRTVGTNAKTTFTNVGASIAGS